MKNRRHNDAPTTVARSGDPAHSSAGWVGVDNPRPRPHATWEYRFLNLGVLTYEEEAVDALNVEGLDGWEVIAYDFGSRRVMMKRRAA